MGRCKYENGEMIKISVMEKEVKQDCEINASRKENVHTINV